MPHWAAGQIDELGLKSEEELQWYSGTVGGGGDVVGGVKGSEMRYGHREGAAHLVLLLQREWFEEGRRSVVKDTGDDTPFRL